MGVEDETLARADEWKVMVPGISTSLFAAELWIGVSRGFEPLWWMDLVSAPRVKIHGTAPGR